MVTDGEMDVHIKDKRQKCGQHWWGTIFMGIEVYPSGNPRRVDGQKKLPPRGVKLNIISDTSHIVFYSGRTQIPYVI